MPRHAQKHSQLELSFLTEIKINIYYNSNFWSIFIVVSAAEFLTLKTTYLEDCEECDGKRIEVGRRCPFLKIELTTKQLHTEQGKDKNKQEEQEQEGDDGTHWIQ